MASKAQLYRHPHTGRAPIAADWSRQSAPCSPKRPVEIKTTLALAAIASRLREYIKIKSVTHWGGLNLYYDEIFMISDL